jgi:hypothetical protein
MSTSPRSEKRVRVAVTYHVCQRWRASMFARLATHDRMEVMVFHEQDVPGTKVINPDDVAGIPQHELRKFPSACGRPVAACPRPQVRRIRLAPARWARTISRPDVAAALEANVFRQAALGILKPAATK